MLAEDANGRCLRCFSPFFSMEQQYFASIGQVIIVYSVCVKIIIKLQKNKEFCTKSSFLGGKIYEDQKVTV